MKKIRSGVEAVLMLAVLVGLALHVGPSRVQAQYGNSQLHRAVGIYDSTRYVGWGMSIASGNGSTGSQTITLCPEWVVLADGTPIRPLATPSGGVFAPITVDPQGSTSETVTPTAYSSVTAPFGYSNPQGTCANVTATFANTHASSLNTSQVVSGDQGVQEAINDAALNNGGKVRWVIDPGIVVLNTGGATTSAGTVSIPTRSVVEVASARVTTTIGTCAGGWSLGITGGTGTDFTGANTTLTAGTTTDSSTITLPKATAATALPTIFCTTSNASAGAVHPHWEGYKVVPPAQ
jgi:hypothetical protein